MQQVLKSTGTLTDHQRPGKAILERLSLTIAIPAVKDFVVREHFVVDISSKAKLKISYLGENFRKICLPMVEKDEVAAEILTANRILEQSFDHVIIAFLGDEPKVGISLGQFFTAFAQQPNGAYHPIPTNGDALIGYIRGFEWAVIGRWYNDGWGFDVRPRVRLSKFNAGSQVLSR